MRRVLLAGLVLFSGVGIACGDDPKEPASPLAKKLAAVQKKFEADQKELQKKLADAKEPDDRKQAEFLLKELSAFAASDAVEIAEEGKKDEAGLDAAIFALKLLGPYQLTGADMDKACAIVLDHHIDSPKIAPALAHLAEAGPTGLQFIETVVEKAMNKEVQAVALYYNALALDAKIGRNEGRASEENIAKAQAEAVAMMEKAVKVAPDVKIGNETLAKAAAVELVSLRMRVGNPVPNIEGTDLDGKKVKLSNYRGKVVLFDFWATWCGPCRAMIPHEQEMVEKLSGKPFALLSVSVDDEQGNLTEFLGRVKMPWAHWWDGATGPVTKMFKVRSYPTLFLIDAKGVLRKKWVGAPDTEALDKAVNELVAEAEAAKR
ncbi:MAG TPA: TlpA disulfide reductase family protein [Gemmataceae bacterium]|nr:TlpA disulfide reductase family protein [Gemmataceae bacterium]